MRILDRYINFNIIKIFTITVFVFCGLYVLIDITSTLDEIIDRKIPINILVKYYLNFFPIILVQTASIACLISSLLTYSAMNNTNEIIVMRASGLNFWQVARPALMFALLITAVIFCLNERLVPQATEVTKEIRDENMILKVDRARKQKEKIKNLTFYGLKNRLYFIDYYSPNTYELNGITIIEHDNHQNIEQKIVALKGKWTGIAWKFYNCQITTYDSTQLNKPDKIKVYKEKLMDIKETPEDFLRQRLNVSAMNIKELHDYIGRFANSGAKKALSNLKVDLYQKYAFPIGNFVIVLIGLPFALLVRSRKGTTFTSVGIAVGIGFLYYVANAVTLAFGKGGLFPPLLSAWAAPMIFTGIALATIKSRFY
ncbi:MAG: LptF/LptG family permease [Candidatus Omnitrophica bacterium]|nr:LptF/LptG family permease [Candidatus Omnitrophota bacterium]